MAREKDPVGIVGTGLMGTACAHRLRAAGFEVVGYDVDAGKLDAFGKTGAKRATSLSDLAAQCRQVVLAVFNTQQVEDTVAGAGGLLKAAKGRQLVTVCVSTCDPDRIAELAARIPPDRILFVEAPISGTSDQTARGDGLGLIGGSEAAVAAAAPVLDAICPRRHHLGAAGNGGRAKLAINLILGINRAGLAEGLVFAERMGLDPGRFLAVARDSAAYSQIMDVKGPKMVAGDFTPHGKIAQTLKDFQLMRDQAARLGQSLPLAATYTDLVEGCMRAGEAELDNAAVMLEIRRRGR
jgi:putative dehydrogenase